MITENKITEIFCMADDSVEICLRNFACMECNSLPNLNPNRSLEKTAITFFQVLLRLHDASDRGYFIEESQIIGANKLRWSENPGLLEQTS